MNGPQHYREAERLTVQANTWANADMGWRAHLSSEERIAYRMADLADAQVHATLALAAATAMGAPVDGEADSGLPPQDATAWNDAAGVNGKGGDR